MIEIHTSDIFDLEDVIDPARLSSTSPSSDSIDIALRAAAEINSSFFREIHRKIKEKLQYY